MANQNINEIKLQNEAYKLRLEEIRLQNEAVKLQNEAYKLRLEEKYKQKYYGLDENRNELAEKNFQLEAVKVIIPVIGIIVFAVIFMLIRH